MALVIEKHNTETMVSGYVVSVTINPTQEFIYGLFKTIEEAEVYAREMSDSYLIKIRQVHMPSKH